MNRPLLSILIPTVIGRENELNALLTKIKGNRAWQEVVFVDDNLRCHMGERMDGLVSFFVAKDNKELSIGEKRERLYAASNGGWSWQIDDDDSIADNAVERILEAAKSGEDYDCITFEERCEMNGNVYRSNFWTGYPDWDGDGSRELYDGFHFHRTPFYKAVIKTEIAKQVPFEHIRYGEDIAFARALKPHLKSEVHFNHEFYIYQHNSKPEDFQSRYGLDK